MSEPISPVSALSQLLRQRGLYAPRNRIDCLYQHTIPSHPVPTRSAVPLPDLPMPPPSSTSSSSTQKRKRGAADSSSPSKRPKTDQQPATPRTSRKPTASNFQKWPLMSGNDRAVRITHDSSFLVDMRTGLLFRLSEEMVDDPDFILEWLAHLLANGQVPPYQQLSYENDVSHFVILPTIRLANLFLDTPSNFRSPVPPSRRYTTPTVNTSGATDFVTESASVEIKGVKVFLGGKVDTLISEARSAPGGLWLRLSGENKYEICSRTTSLDEGTGDLSVTYTPIPSLWGKPASVVAQALEEMFTNETPVVILVTRDSSVILRLDPSGGLQISDKIVHASPRSGKLVDPPPNLLCALVAISLLSDIDDTVNYIKTINQRLALQNARGNTSNRDMPSGENQAESSTAATAQSHISGTGDDNGTLPGGKASYPGEHDALLSENLQKEASTEESLASGSVWSSPSTTADGSGQGRHWYQGNGGETLEGYSYNKGGGDGRQSWANQHLRPKPDSTLPLSCIPGFTMISSISPPTQCSPCSRYPLTDIAEYSFHPAAETATTPPRPHNPIAFNPDMSPQSSPEQILGTPAPVVIPSLTINGGYWATDQARFSTASVHLTEFVSRGRLWDCYRAQLLLSSYTSVDGGESVVKSPQSFTIIAKITVPDQCTYSGSTDSDGSGTVYRPLEANRAVTREVQLYRHALAPLQGSRVPHFYGLWEGLKDLRGPAVKIMLLQDLGPSLAQVGETWETLQPAIRFNIAQTYRHLHQRGILHNDVELRHVCIPPSSATVFLIDFEDSLFVEEDETTWEAVRNEDKYVEHLAGL